MKHLLFASVLVGSLSVPTLAVEIVWPQNRTTFAAGERIEIAVADLGGAEARIQLRPQKPGATEVTIPLKGQGTAGVTLPPQSLSPGTYDVLLDGKPSGTLKVVTGVRRSSMLLSATSVTAPHGGNNAIVGNLFRFGLLDQNGLPLADVRGKKSPGMAGMESWLGSDLPVLVYMYWTGFVTHKPWGSEKSWANAEMQDAMRLFNFANAQRMRQYAPAIASVGPIDEPGLGWGKTPAGGIASGFPNADEKAWYEARDWKYTQDIAGQSDTDWVKYVDLRAKILEESYAQANKDIKAVWPEAVFEGDLYAPSAIMDGTNPMNQRANDTPTSHVFFDFFGGPMSVPGLIALEKSHDPTAHLAHAMNGQLTGVQGPQLPLYHLLMNAMLQGGIKSNWWLNTGGLKREEMAAVHAPVEKFGPLLQNMKSRADVALLWGHTELAMRQKAMAARESTKKGGEQIKLMVPLPQTGELSEAELVSNAYEVGGTYANQVLYTHQALIRSGYPAHIVHESILPEGALDQYKVLVITGQQAEFPAKVREAIQKFTARGGRVVVDGSTTTPLPGALKHEARLSESDIRAWTAQLERDGKAATNTLERSHFLAMHTIIKPALDAVQPIKKTLAATGIAPSVKTEATDLSIARYEGGEGSLFMVLNGHESFPQMEEAQSYPRYNPAPYRATYNLPAIPKGSVVYKVAGLDWANSQRLTSLATAQTDDFAAGEMKLYLVAARQPRGLGLTSRITDGVLHLKAQLNGLKMPWPLQLEVRNPAGGVVYSLYRATGADGALSESLPLGANAAPGDYSISITSPVADLKASSVAKHQPKPVIVAALSEPVEVFDEKAIHALLKSRQNLTIAVGDESQRAVADALARDLSTAGVPVQVRGEAELLRRANYPRIWNSTVTVYAPSEKDQSLPEGDKVERQVTLSLNPQGEEIALDAESKPLSAEWRQPNTLVTITGDGWVDWLAQDKEAVYQPGTKFFINANRQLTLVNGEPKEVEATPEFRKQWSRPWTKLTSYNGNYQLPPQLPEAYATDGHLIVLGDSHTSQIARALQASEILPRVVDAKYPGAGKSLLQFAWSPFAVEKHVIFIGASDAAGLGAGARQLAALAK